MALHEKMKQAIIAEEIIGYFFEKGFTDIDIAIRITESQTTFMITVYDKEISFIDELKDILYCCRDRELEEYGWELFTDNRPSNLLESLGMLIDNYSVKEETDKTIVTFIRNHS